MRKVIINFQNGTVESVEYLVDNEKKATYWDIDYCIQDLNEDCKEHELLEVIERYYENSND